MKRTRKINMTSSSLSDPMNPLDNTILKEKRINVISNFLITNNYPNNFNKKDFANMCLDFRPILKFIIQKLDPIEDPLDSLTDDRIEFVAKIYDYPGKLTKAMIRDFNTPSNFLYIITFMCYMVNLATMKEHYIEKKIKQKSYSGVNPLGNQEMYEFMNQCINNNSNITQILKNYRNKYYTLSSEQIAQSDKIYEEINKLEQQRHELEQKLPNVDSLKNQKNELVNNFKIFNDSYEESCKEFKKLTEQKKNLETNIINQQKELKQIEIDTINTRKIIDNQIMSRAEYDIKIEKNKSILKEIDFKNKEIEKAKQNNDRISKNNANLTGKLTILCNDINNTHSENSKKYNKNKKTNDNYLFNMTKIVEEIKSNIENGKQGNNDELIKKYDELLLNYEKYITDIQNEYNENCNKKNEFIKKKNSIVKEITKYNNLIINDTQLIRDREEKEKKATDDFDKFEKDSADNFNSIQNNIKKWDQSIKEKKIKRLNSINQLSQKRDELGDYSKETHDFIDTLIQKYKSHRNILIQFSNAISEKIADKNKKLNEIIHKNLKNSNNQNNEVAK